MLPKLGGRARGGEKIFPRDVEEYRHTHPAIAEGQVEQAIAEIRAKRAARARAAR